MQQFSRNGSWNTGSHQKSKKSQLSQVNEALFQEVGILSYHPHWKNETGVLNVGWRAVELYQFSELLLHVNFKAGTLSIDFYN